MWELPKFTAEFSKFLVMMILIIVVMKVKVLFSLCPLNINPLNAELNPICHLLALLGAHHIFHVSGLRVKTHATQYY
jgi:hypothetical protein